MVNFTCDQCERKYIYIYIYRRNLDHHVRRNHATHPVFDFECERSFARSTHLEKHKRTCTQVAIVPAAKRCDVDSEFKLRKTRKSLGGDVEQYTVNMKEAKNLSALQKAIAVCTSVMVM